MGDGNFLRFADFGQRSAIGRIHEDRVVPKAARSSGSLSDLSLDDAGGFVDHLAARDARERRYESRRARLTAMADEPAEDLGEAFVVGRIRIK